MQLRLIILPLSLASLIACGGDDHHTTLVDGGGFTHTDGSVAMDAGHIGIDSSIGQPGGDAGLSDSGTVSLNDAQIAGVLAAVNTGEIKQGMYAADKAQAKGVMDYANLMVTMHSQAQSEQATLLQTLQITPADSAVSVSLTGDASMVLQKLESTAAGDAFDYQYVKAQADQHQAVLSLIDSTLLPEAANAQLKAALQAARSMVSMHLDAAKALLANFTQASDGGVIFSANAGTP